jgi:LysM repeat protein
MATKLPRSLSPRMIAPAALVLFAIVLLIVIAGSLGGSGSGGEQRGAATRSSQTNRPVRERGTTGTTEVRRTYVVKPGDTLARIAERTGVSIERLVALNPTIDPQALVTGQRIKLRE